MGKFYTTDNLQSKLSVVECLPHGRNEYTVRASNRLVIHRVYGYIGYISFMRNSIFWNKVLEICCAHGAHGAHGACRSP
jgi:hypothetical protein